MRSPKSLLFAAAFLSICAPFSVEAASLYFFPESAVKVVGSDFTVNAFVNSSEQTMSALSGRIEFPADKLEVVSVSTLNTMINAWSQEPVFSNEEGAIRFEGIALGGFKGGTGRIFAITFRPKSSGSAILKYAEGSILANDGEGTDILRTRGAAIFTLQSDSLTPVPDSPAKRLPGLPVINSATHPMEDRWYNAKKLELNWDIPPGADGVSYALDASPNFQLVPQGKGLISNVQYDVSGFKDGVWYFYMRFHTPAGWGPTGRRMVRMDFTPPVSGKLNRLNSDDPANPRPEYSWQSTDATAGVVKYQSKIGDGDWEDISLDANERYALPPQLPGERQVAIRSFDEAGNHSDTAAVFTVEPIQAPVVTDFSEEFFTSDFFVAEGRALPEATVRLFLRSDKSEDAYEVKAGKDGNWRVEWRERRGSGIWRLSAMAIDARGGQSLETQEAEVLAISPWAKVQASFAQAFSILGFILLAAGALLGFGYFVFGHTILYRLGLKQDFAEFKSKVRGELKALEGDLEQLKGLAGGEAALKNIENRLRGDLSRLVEDVQHESDKIDKL